MPTCEFIEKNCKAFNLLQRRYHGPRHQAIALAAEFEYPAPSPYWWLGLQVCVVLQKVASTATTASILGMLVLGATSVLSWPTGRFAPRFRMEDGLIDLDDSDLEGNARDLAGTPFAASPTSFPGGDFPMASCWCSTVRSDLGTRPAPRFCRACDQLRNFVGVSRVPGGEVDAARTTR